MKVNTKQTKIIVFRGLEIIVTKICINVIILEQINVLNSLGCDVSVKEKRV
jgi:hypothetical protein